MSSEPQNHDLRHDLARRRAVAGHRTVAGREGGDRGHSSSGSESTSSRLGSRSPRRETSKASGLSPPQSSAQRRLPCADAQGGHRRRSGGPCGRPPVAHPRLSRHQPHPHGAQAPPRAGGGRRAGPLGRGLRAQPRRRGRVLVRGRDALRARVRGAGVRARPSGPARRRSTCRIRSATASRSEYARVPRRDPALCPELERRRALRPLPRRPRPRRRQHARRHQGGRHPGRGDDQRARRARRQRGARGGRHGAARPPRRLRGATRTSTSARSGAARGSSRS